jgi:hypothetical protein
MVISGGSQGQLRKPVTRIINNIEPGVRQNSWKSCLHWAMYDFWQIVSGLNEVSNGSCYGHTGYPQATGRFA